MAVPFSYPQNGWSTGNMRMAKRGMPMGDPGYPIRELEGERKRRETKVSQAEVGERKGMLDPEIMEAVRKKKQFNPDSLSDDELRKHYRKSFQQNEPVTLFGSDREFKLYYEQLDAHQKAGDLYQMSPRQLKEQGVMPDANSPRVPQ